VTAYKRGRGEKGGRKAGCSVNISVKTKCKKLGAYANLPAIVLQKTGGERSELGEGGASGKPRDNGKSTSTRHHQRKKRFVSYKNRKRDEEYEMTAPILEERKKKEAKIRRKRGSGEKGECPSET